MALRDPINVWFSELADNYEECAFYYEMPGRRLEGRYRRCGDLPDGRHYGVWYSRASDPWPASYELAIVEKSGEMTDTTSSFCEVPSLSRSGHVSYPSAVAASPSGKSLVCIVNGRLWACRQKAGRFGLMSSIHCLSQRLEDQPIRDARMLPDGTLELWNEEKLFAVYLCDEDIVLLSP